MHFPVLLLATSLSRCRGQRYSISRSWNGPQIFDDFDFVTHDDPNGGYVNYVDKPVATEQGLASISNGAAIIKVDNTTQNVSGRGRNSVWLQSRDTFGAGTLLVASFAHVPSGACGVWPSL
jgi:hypothetical protein